MKRLTTLVAALVMVGMSVSTARAVIVFQDNFDSYFDGFGNPNQTAFTNVWAPIGCQGQGASCTLNTTSTTSNQVSNDFLGVDPAHEKAILNHSPPGAPASGDSAERNQLTFPASPTVHIGDKLSFSFDFYDVNPAAAPFRQYINLQTSLAVGTAPAGQLVSMGLNNNQAASASGGNYYMARILGFVNPTVDPDGGPDEALAATNYIKLNDYDPTPLDSIADGPGARGTTTAQAAWHNLKVEITTPDNASTDFNFFVDGAHAEHVSVPNAPVTYAALRMGAGVSSTTDAYFDNILVEFTPGAVGLTGDYNGDGKVNAADYVDWRITNINGQQGYTDWRAHFGESLGSGNLVGGNSPVPEPMTLGLVLTGVAGLGLGRRKRVAYRL